MKLSIKDKIEKLASWVAHESDDTQGEIEVLLYAMYLPKLNGLSGDIDDDYKDVLEHLGIEVSK
tara:strand:+ start:155 stop:346 length:192 start_codon:yes stop_codon:yes gene_type:complete